LTENHARSERPGDALLAHGLTRPRSPAPELLDDARRGLERLGFTPSGRWEVLSREERPQSTLFVLGILSSGKPVRVYYKQEYVGQLHRDDAGRRRQAFRRCRALRVEEALNDDVCDRLGREGLLASRILASRPSELTAIRLEISGKPLGRLAWRGASTLPRSLDRMFEAVGRGLRIIESVGRAGPSPRPSASAEVRRRILDDLWRCGARLPTSARRRIEACAEFHIEQLEAEGGLWYVHGDINHTNVRVCRGRVAYIDFGWEPGPPRADLTDLMWRLRLQRPQVRPVTHRTTAALLRGYQSESPGRTVGSTLAQLRWVARGLRSNLPRFQRLAQAELASLDCPITFVERGGDDRGSGTWGPPWEYAGE
jgi:hypothetical protein